MIKLSRDKNGNKIVTYSPGKGQRGFSVQTNGNMPVTDRMSKWDFNEAVALEEMRGYVRLYGTDRQKDLIDQ